MEQRDVHRQKYYASPSPPAKVGDIVLVHDPDHPRGVWKMAKIQRLLAGKDGLNRGAVLKVANKVED